jgi:glutathione S-transferase
MGKQELEGLVAAARAELDDPTRTRVVGAAGAETPRFELFHAGMSMCSQKVRTVLAEKAIPYTSHELVIVASKGIYTEEFKPAENYRPGYVKLRIYGGMELGSAYAEAHTGSSSVETEGFDACVVPVLVDHQERRVIVDSKRICEHLDRVGEGPIRLIPQEANARAEVMAQVDTVDRTPHPGFLYGFHPDDDRRPDFVKAVMADVHDVKCGSLQKFIDDNRGDEQLVAAYRSKIAKERAGKALAFDPERQRAVRSRAQRVIEEFDARLGARGAPWLCGADYTLADAVWGISLYRMHWLGLATLWSHMPRVGEYAARAYKRPSVAEQVIHYPSPMPPSPHTADIH